MITLARATPNDIAFIMATERMPGYDALVGRFSEEEHRANLADGNWLYFVGMDESGKARGFAILQDRNKRDGNTYLRRIAVPDAGGGFGRPFLAAIIDWAFSNSDDTRFWLSVHEINARARHVYSSLGLVEEGPTPEAEHPSIIMAVSKQAWLARWKTATG